MSATPLRTLTCPTCGAPVSFADQAREVTCRFCGSVIERSDDAPTNDDHTNALRIDMTGDHIRVDAPAGGTQSAHKFVIKMGDGGPMVIDMGDLNRLRAPGGVFSSSTSYTSSTSSPVRTDAFTGSLPSTPMPVVRPRRSGGGCGMVIGLLGTVIGLAVAAIVATGAGAWLLGGILPGSSNTNSIGDLVQEAVDQATTGLTNTTFNGDAGVVLGEGDHPGALVVPGTQYQASGDQTTALFAIDASTGKLAWQTEPFPKTDEIYRARIVADSTHVFAVVGNNLYSFKRSDGTQEWRASVSDKLPYCDAPGCLALVDGKVITLADDGVLQAFDPKADGRELWRATLNNTPRQIYTAGDRVAVLDRDSDNQGYMRIFDASDGNEDAVNLSCEVDSFTSDLDDSPVIQLDADTGDLIVFYGTFGTCGARLDAATLAPVWELNLGGDVRQRSFGSSVLLDDGIFVTLTDDGLMLVNADAGELLTTVQFENVEVAPLMVNDGHLILRAKTTRGTARYEIWSLSATTGEREWTYRLDDEIEPIDPPDGSGSAAWDGDTRFSVAALDDGLAVTVFRVSDKDGLTADISKLNFDTGASQSDKHIDLVNADFSMSYVLSIVDRSNGRLLVADTSKIYWIDLESGSLISRWP